MLKLVPRSIQIDCAELDDTLAINLKEIFSQDLNKYPKFCLLQEYYEDLFSIVKYILR
jgi:hypothetical protein